MVKPWIDKILKRIFYDEKGFTLIEIVVVMVLMGILLIMTAPRMYNWATKDSDNFALFTSTITKAFDDSFLNDRTNFLVIHLYEPFEEETEMGDEIFGRNNGLSVVLFEEGKFVENERKVFKFREFDDDFRIEEVVLGLPILVATSENIIVSYYTEF